RRIGDPLKHGTLQDWRGDAGNTGTPAVLASTLRRTISLHVGCEGPWRHRHVWLRIHRSAFRVRAFDALRRTLQPSAIPHTAGVRSPLGKIRNGLNMQLPACITS